MRIITIHIHRAESHDNSNAVSIADDADVESLLKLTFPEQHSDFEMFFPGNAQSLPCHYRLNECEIKDGDHLHCRPRPNVVRVHIDQEAYESAYVTTGAALYATGSILTGRQLYREVEGNEEDEPIFNDTEAVFLKQDEHFHSSEKPFQGFTITVNARPKVVHKKLLTFSDVVALAFNPPPSGPNVTLTVVYRKAAGNRHEGTLVQGQTVKIKNGTIFNVTATDKS